jgi:MoxR-like ATPase
MQQPYLLRSLGVYGYDAVEPVILASLVSEDPLLLIGKAGTGKTFLLNSLSEALGLEHRHYNASLIAFDDLVGFPWPETDGTGMRYLETPATVWGAESVLVDEISRCKPEHQNRLFSLIHERRIQGLPLPRLRYRWAAMNPAGFDQEGESYVGSEALDPALADRFAFLVEVADWTDLSPGDQSLVADPRGEGAISRDGCGLLAFLQGAKHRFDDLLKEPRAAILGYACEVTSYLGKAGLRISPRRARQLARNLLALEAVSNLPQEQLFRLGLNWSLPHRAGVQQPDEELIHGAHREAWLKVCAEGEEKWLHQFHQQPDIAEKADTGTVAISQLIASGAAQNVLAFAFCLAPALLLHRHPPVGAEGIQDLAKIAGITAEVDGTLRWRDSARTPLYPESGKQWQGVHPAWKKIEPVLKKLRGRRKQRALQVFGYLALDKALPADPASFEESLQRCFLVVKNFHGTSSE